MPQRQAQSIGSNAVQHLAKPSVHVLVDAADHSAIGRVLRQPSVGQRRATWQRQHLLSRLDMQQPAPLLQWVQLNLQLFQPLLFPVDQALEPWAVQGPCGPNGCGAEQQPQFSTSLGATGQGLSELCPVEVLQVG